MKTIRNLLQGIAWAALILLALNIESLASFLGWDGLVVDLIEAPHVLSFLIGPKATYIYILVLTFFVGFSLDGVFRRIETKRLSAVKSLGDDAMGLAGKLALLSGNSLASPREYPAGKYNADITVMRARLGAYNVWLPDRSDFEPLFSESVSKSDSQFLAALSSELRTVGVYLKSGQKNLAELRYKESMSELSNKIEAHKRHLALEARIDAHERSLRS